MTTMTAAEIAEHEAREVLGLRFRSLSGSDFEVLPDLRDVVAKVLPDVTATLGGHEHSTAETLVWHGLDGWEALVVDPAHSDPLATRWIDASWPARSFYFAQTLMFGLDAHAQTALGLAEAVAAMDLSVRDMVAALTVIATVAPAQEQQAILDLRVEAMGAYVAAGDFVLDEDGYVQVRGF